MPHLYGIPYLIPQKANRFNMKDILKTKTRSKFMIYNMKKKINSTMIESIKIEIV